MFPGVGVNHEELVGLAKQHFSGVSFEYQDDAVPVLSPCRFTGSEVSRVWICGTPVLLNATHEIFFYFFVCLRPYTCFL